MKKYNVLIYGSGGRENALAWKISQSPMLNKLFLTLANDGFKNLGEEITFLDFGDLAKKCVENKIDLVVIGPEAPLAQGVVDILNKAGIKCIGPNKRWARLEGSKSFAKEFMVKYGISTAKYFVVNSKDDIESVLSKFSSQNLAPPVIKADGLAAGKGVHLSFDFYDAKRALNEFLSGRFGEASSSVVVEERLEGEELSVISLFDGKTLLSFVPARDYKRLFDNQMGPNTGGMGAYCPVDLSKNQGNDLQKYLETLEKALKSEKAEFAGVIYSGIMLTKEGIKLLEYNMRFGDPETQSLMYHLDSDLLDIFLKATEQQLSKVDLKWKSGTTINVVVASQGYPENPKKGFIIKGIKEACKKYGTQEFYAGVALKENMMLSNGGRVLNICANGSDIEKVRDKIYKTIEEIDFKDKTYRKDIGAVLTKV